MDAAATEGELGGRRVLVIGGGSGIGRAIRRLALARGARVAMTVLNEAEAAAVTAESPEIAAARPLDIRRREDVGPALDAMVEALGGALDAMVYCAGILLRTPTEAMAEEEWDRLMDINLHGCFRAVRAALPALRRSGGTSDPRASGAAPGIVVISSQLGIVGFRNGAAYAASKSGLNGLIRSLALEYAAEGIRVNAVGPGPTATPMTVASRADPARYAEMVGAIPMGRYGEPEEIAEVALFLASARASFVTGQLWCADGGYVAR